MFPISSEGGGVGRHSASILLPLGYVEREGLDYYSLSLDGRGLG